MRDYNLHLEDILISIDKIQKYLNGMTLEEFLENDLVLDAVIRNLAIIGEASRHLSASVWKKRINVEWEKIVGLRNILIHEYFGVDNEILWDIVQNKLPLFKKEIVAYLKKR